jgi:diguanylate cyclase (GGDEF)-like protein
MDNKLLSKQNVKELAVINDDPDDLALLRQLAKSSEEQHRSFRLLEYSSCKEAAVAMHQHQPCCYLISYDQPKSQILDFIKSLRRRKLYESIPIIILADEEQSDISTVGEILKYGVQDYLIRQELTAFKFLRSIEVAVHHSESQRELYEMAHFDQLTGLLGRHLFNDRLQNTIHYCDRFNQGCSLLYIDVDNFKVVNDCYGHEAGDELLKTIAQRIKRNCRSTDSAARLGGDEFAILISGVDKEKSHKTAEKLLEKVSEPIEIDSYSLHVSLSIGIAHYPDTADSIEDFLEQADQAMYRAKKSGKARYFQFSQRQQLQRERQNRLETLLPEALANDEFELEYQAILNNLRGSLYSVDVGVKWSPGRYKVSVAEFNEMIERLDLSEPYNKWLIDRSLSELKSSQDVSSVYDLPLRLPMNHFVSETMIGYLSGQLKAYNIQPQQLEIEIGEALLMRNLAVSQKCLQDLSRIGFRISIGAFDGQYSALDNLTVLPLDTIKIDPSCFIQVEDSQQKQRTIEAIAQLGKVLGIKIIASGIQNKPQYNIAKKLGCDFVQGDYIAEARPDLSKYKRYAKSAVSSLEAAH